MSGIKWRVGEVSSTDTVKDAPYFCRVYCSTPESEDETSCIFAIVRGTTEDEALRNANTLYELCLKQYFSMAGCFSQS